MTSKILSHTIPSFKYAEIQTSHAFAVTGKIYLHDGDVFALDICFDLYLQLFDDMGQTI